MSPCTSSNLPESGVGHTIRIPIWSCSGWGLPCHWCYHQRGALLPHHFTLTCEGGIFSVALAVGLRRPDVIWHPALRSPDFPPTAESTGVVPVPAVLNRPRPSSVGSDYPADSRPIVKWKITNKTSVISAGSMGHGRTGITHSFPAQALAGTVLCGCPPVFQKRWIQPVSHSVNFPGVFSANGPSPAACHPLVDPHHGS